MSGRLNKSFVTYKRWANNEYWKLFCHTAAESVEPNNPFKVCYFCDCLFRQAISPGWHLAIFICVVSVNIFSTLSVDTRVETTIIIQPSRNINILSHHWPVVDTWFRVGQAQVYQVTTLDSVLRTPARVHIRVLQSLVDPDNMLLEKGSLIIIFPDCRMLRPPPPLKSWINDNKWTLP